MSFNARLNDSRRVQRGSGKPATNGRHYSASAAAQATEDKQPNESINKRALTNPPIIRSTQPPPRGHGGRGRGRPPRGGGFNKGFANGSSSASAHSGNDQASPGRLVDILRAKAGVPTRRTTVGDGPSGTAIPPHSTESAAVQPGEPSAAASNNHPAGRHKKWRSRRGGSGSKASTHSPAVSERDYIPANAHAAEPPRKKRKITPDIPDLEYPSYSDIVAPSPPSIDPQLPAASDAIATNVTPPVAGPSEATVKHERSPSPALPSGPVPVKEGALRCAPIPEACKKGRPGFQEKRRAWVAEKKKYLQKLNIEPVRVFLRDDGMVIDWSSPIPVMSDTLLPPRPADNATMPCDRESSPEIIEIDNPGLPAPPNGASLPRRSTANPIRPLISSKEDDDTDVLPRAIPNNAPARSVREANPEVLENGPNQATPLTDALQPQRSAAGPFRPSALSINSMHAEMLPPTGLEYTQNGREASIDIMDIDHPNQPAPPAQHSTADPSRPPASREKANDVNMLPSPKPLPLPLPRRSSLKATRTTHSLQPDAGQVDDNNPAPAPPAVDLLQLIPNTSPPPLSAEEAELERGALAFLRNYIRLFDRDRTALVRAYSHVATFSVTTHDPSRPASLPSPRALARRLRQGRTDLLGGLLLLPAGRKFLPEGPRGVKYDVVCLGAENKLEVLLMCYVEETKDEDGLVWACDQRFVLRKKEWDDVDRSTGGLWPLVAVSHQMTIREKIPELPRPTAL